MRILLTLAGCCMAVVSMAQAPQNLRIKLSYDGAGTHLEQAVETIEAVNVITASSTVDYQAGQSVTLLPGFEARRGSTFAAFIKPVSNAPSSVAGSEFPLRLSAYPNPFEQSTTIEYDLPADGKVNLFITDTQGKVVGQLVQDETQTAGRHRMEWTPAAVGPGVYIPVVESNQKRVASRLVKK